LIRQIIYNIENKKEQINFLVFIKNKLVTYLNNIQYFKVVTSNKEILDLKNCIETFSVLVIRLSRVQWIL
jgi:hypothetical protein